MSQRDILQRTYGYKKRMESHQAVHTPREEGNQDKGESSHYPSYRRTAEPDGPNLIPSGSEGVYQPNSPVASHHSGTRRSVANSHCYLQSKVVSRRRQ
ncbi:hypothetical protein O181_022530 [Austropuccinia psidii MF-1]|uniref:Uncharacterized protein n=1 Tax=Austropuccinia psidii MF-1 TaxID=1389203 RepID=A0A9Q3GY62_9BASI|nr:hypothetical protein [Austropuccinia psidii MF-1]